MLVAVTIIPITLGLWVGDEGSPGAGSTANLLIGPTEILLYSGSSAISTRDRHYLELKALEDSSVDFYAALRSGFYQQRIDEIWGRREGHRTSEEPHLSESDGVTLREEGEEGEEGEVVAISADER